MKKEHDVNVIKLRNGGLYLDFTGMGLRDKLYHVKRLITGNSIEYVVDKDVVAKILNVLTNK